MSGNKAHSAPSRTHNALSKESPTLYHHDSLLRKSDHSTSALAPAGVKTITSVNTKRPSNISLLASDNKPESINSLITLRSSCGISCIFGNALTEAFRKAKTYASNVTGSRLSSEVSAALWPVIGGLIGCVLAFMMGWWVRNG